VFLFHGTADLSVPPAIATAFAEALRAVGARVQCKLYAGKSHTDPIIEDLLYADEVRRRAALHMSLGARAVSLSGVGAWGGGPAKLVSDDLMTDVLSAVWDGSLPSRAGGTLARRYSRPSFGDPTSPDRPVHPAVATAPRRPPQPVRRSVLPKALVTFARAVNPF
jgi:hypothetical protein